MARKRKTPDNERWAKYLAGELAVRDMDEEELYRQRWRSRDGKFTGRAPERVPARFAREVITELYFRGDSEFRRDILRAIRHLRNLAFNAEKEDVQLKATLAWIERVFGLPTQRVVLSEGQPEWLGALQDLMDGADDVKIERVRERLGGEEIDGSRFARPVRKELGGSGDPFGGPTIARAPTRRDESIDWQEPTDDGLTEEDRARALLEEDRALGLF
jgi:hypothetical protein